MFEEPPIIPTSGKVCSTLPDVVIRREIRRVSRQRRRARRYGLPATLTLAQWLHTLNQHHWQCAYCGGMFETIEHVVRLADGGGTVQANCVPACSSCNKLRNHAAAWVASMEEARQANRLYIVIDIIGTAGAVYA